MAGGFVGVDLFLASGRLLGSCALSVRCGPGNTGQNTIGFEIEIEIPPDATQTQLVATQ